MRVFLICTVTLHREGLAEVLARRHGIEIAGATADPAAVPAALADGQTIVVLDMTGLDPSVVAPRVAQATDARVLAINVPTDERDVIACAEAGFACCLTAEASLEQLVLAIGSAGRDQAPCSPWTAAVLLRRVAVLARERRRVPSGAPDAAGARLTIREFEIAGLIEQGLSNREIAHQLCIELPTVKNHVHRIFDKLGVHRRAEAAALVRGGAIRGVGLCQSTSPVPV